MQINPEQLKGVIGFKPTEKQGEILANLKRFNVVVGGRRVGKTYLISYLALRELLVGQRQIWVVAPQYNLCKRVWDYLHEWAIRHFSESLQINKSEMTISNLVTGSLLELKSAENLPSLKGKGLDLLIVDEAGDVPEEVWDKYLRGNIAEIRPALGREKGRAVLIGNASSIGSWFYRLYETDTIEDKFSYWLPSAVERNGEVIASNNPEIISLQELKEIKTSSSSRTWEVEWMARFLPGQGQVFRNVRNNIRETSSPPFYSHRYLMGVDLARKQDFSVISVVDIGTGDLVYFSRFQELDWGFQKAKIVDIAKHYNNARIKIDATGLGDVILHDLEREKVNVEGINFTIDTKKQIIEKLALLIEKGDIHYPEVDALISELEAFEYLYSKTGKIVYSAPSGLHDDCVISLALAVAELPEKRTPIPQKSLQERWKEYSRRSLDRLLESKTSQRSQVRNPYEYM